MKYEPYENIIDYPLFVPMYHYEPNQRQSIVIEATRQAMGKLSQNDQDNFVYQTPLVKEVMALLSVPDNHPCANATKEENLEFGKIGTDVYYAREYIEAKKYYADQSAIMRRLGITKGQKFGSFKEEYGKLKRNIFIETVTDIGAVILFTQGNKRYRQSINAKGLEEIYNYNNKERKNLPLESFLEENILN